jgi:hypothetical protein
VEIVEKLLAARDLVGCKWFTERAVEADPLLPDTDELLRMDSLLWKCKGGVRVACSLAGSRHDAPGARKRSCRDPEKQKPSSDDRARHPNLRRHPPPLRRSLPIPGAPAQAAVGAEQQQAKIWDGGGGAARI